MNRFQPLRVNVAVGQGRKQPEPSMRWKLAPRTPPTSGSGQFAGRTAARDESTGSQPAPPSSQHAATAECHQARWDASKRAVSAAQAASAAAHVALQARGDDAARPHASAATAA